MTRTSLGLAVAFSLASATTLAAQGININDKASQFGVLHTDYDSKVWIGGGKSDAASIVSQDFADITGGSDIRDSQIEALFTAAVGGSGWNNEHGLAGTRIGFITPEGFSLEVNGAQGSTETLWFAGSFTQAIIANNAAGNVDIKNKNSQFAEFYSEGTGSIWIGGGKSDSVRIVSQEFADITGGSRIDCNKRGNLEVAGLLRAATEDQGWNNYHGIENARLIGLTLDSFTLEFNGNGPSVERILFTGPCAADAVAAADFGMVDTKDNKSRLAIFNTDTRNSMFIGGGASQVSEEFKALVGGSSIDVNEAVALFQALVEHKGAGVEDARLLGITGNSFAVQLDASGPSKETILFTGTAIADAIDAFLAPAAN